MANWESESTGSALLMWELIFRHVRGPPKSCYLTAQTAGKPSAICPLREKRNLDLLLSRIELWHFSKQRINSLSFS